MNDNSFSVILKKTRNDYGLTQEEASENVCSIRHYKRIESGEITPSAYVLNELSKKFNYDFNALYNALNVDGADIYAWKAAVSSSLSRKDYSMFKEHINAADSLPQVKSVRMIQKYLQGLLLFNVNNEADTAIATLQEGLLLENPMFSLRNIGIRSNEGLCILNLYASCLTAKGHFSDAALLYKYMSDRLSFIIETNGNFYESSSFISSFYPKCIGSYVTLLIKELQYDTAMKEVTRAANVLQTHFLLKYLHLLLWKKVELLCIIDEKDEARKTFVQMKSLCELLGYDDFLTRKTAYIQEVYNGILQKDI